MYSEYFSFEDFAGNFKPNSPQSLPLKKAMGLLTSKKPVYELAREVLGSDQSELAVQLKEVFRLLDKKQIAVPVIHITCNSIINSKGESLSTSFLENIQENGFKGGRATNVGGFNNRKSILGTPQDFLAEPWEWVRGLHEILEYMKHGIRTNKPCLGELQKQGQGLPIMIIVDSTNLPLSGGSDRLSHYQFKEPVGPESIIGIVELIRNEKLINRFNVEDLRWVVKEFLDKTQKYVENSC